MEAKNLITAKKETDTKYQLSWENGVYIGDFLQDVNGYFYFLPAKDTFNGLWDEFFLKALYEKLKEFNKPLDDEMEEYFKNNP